MNVIRGFMGLYDGLDPWILMGIRLPVAELLDAPVPW
jgi:cobyrinic acid a,c-diamide synthase